MNPSTSAPSPLTARARVIFGATTGNLFGIVCTVNSTLGVLLVPISQEFHWSRTAVAGAFTATSLANAAALPLAGRATDCFGARAVVVWGFALFGLSIMALATITARPAAYYGLFALAGMLGALPSNAALSKLLSEWFDGQRGFWLGFTAGVGNGVGSALMPIIAAALLGPHGFRSAFLGLGLLVLLIAAPVAWATLRPPARLAHAGGHEDALLTGYTLREALHRPLFWVIFSSVPLVAGSLTAVFANTVPIMLSRGLTLTQAMGVVATFALICTAGQPFAGWLLDRADRPRVVAPFYAVSATGIAVFVLGEGQAAMLAGGALTGIGLGADYCVMTYILSRYFGLRAMGAITGMAFAAVLIANAIMPIALNFAFDRTGSYAITLTLVSALLAYAVLILSLLPRYPQADSLP